MERSDAQALDRGAQTRTTATVVVAVLGVIAALHLMKVILVPVAFAILLACLLAPATKFLRRVLPLGSTGAAVVLFLLLTLLGLYLATLAAESLITAAHTLPADAEQFSGRLSRRISEIVREQPYLRGILPEPGTIDLWGDRNRRLLIVALSDRLADVSAWVVQGLIILVLAMFVLAESEMLAPKVIRFFAPAPGDARAAERSLAMLTRQLRNYLVLRTLINIALGGIVAVVLWFMGIRYALALGGFAALANFVPYLGQFLAGALPVLVVLGQSESFGDAFLFAAGYTAVLGIEGYVVTPYLMGRSLDLNGTTVLLACLFWGFLWGLVGLILAVPIAIGLKLVFQTDASLHRWAELMSREWQPPEPPRPLAATAREPGSESAPAA